MVTEQTLPGITSAVETFYAEEYEPKVPGIRLFMFAVYFSLTMQNKFINYKKILVIAVAIGPSILFYRNMKPYYKYTLPSLNIEPLERDIWRKASINQFV